MSDWKLIEEKPAAPIAAILFYPAIGWPTVSPERELAIKLESAFWDGERWVEAGTGHDVFEDWKGQDQLPSHWMEVQAPSPAKTGVAA